VPKVLPRARGLIVKPALHGLGIFATRFFHTGERVFEVTGKRITGYVDEDIDEETRNNAIRVSANWYISPAGRMGDYINHSCDPNCAIRKVGKKLYVVAIRPIYPNWEIYIDYSTILASDDVWQMNCLCGSGRCRKTIKRFKLLPKKLQADYIKRRIVPPYILRS
jgi:SET domain-containing protein